MAEVKVEKPEALAKRETPEMNVFNDFFAPLFPARRFFGLNPFGMNPFGLMGGFGELMRPPEAWAPVMDIRRCNGDLVVTAELPGLKKEEVKIEITDEGLVIEGERKREHTEDHKGYHRYERSYGKFYRSIPLPEGAKMEEAKAELNNGILKITVPVPEAKKHVRQIAVEDAATEKKVAAA